jgi:hypothetical protein
MGGAIVIVGAVAAALVIYCFTWLRSISFLYFALAFGGVIVFNILINWIRVARQGGRLEKKVWNNAGVLFLILLIGCAIALIWPKSGLGGGILFILAVLGGTAMLVREIWVD